MEQAKIDRINELARKAGTAGLTEEEAEERRILRLEYVATFRSGLASQLDNLYLRDETGAETKLRRKDDK